ncbi:MAG: hypothetical protein EU539_05830 [Promethearchaeota archaeon]|nr:MAG: hypothetical protein EU539_05830 [Candidatus Lokiarchaeota archaeon]
MNEKQDNDKHELDKIRMRKMKALMDAQKKNKDTQEKKTSIWDKVDYLLRAVLMPEAYTRLEHFKKNEPAVYNSIINELISPDVVQSIDYLISIIAQRGGVPKRIPEDVIIYLERKAKGIKSKIKVKQGDGEMMDLGAYLKK